MKTFSNITKKQVAEKGVQALANRPNAASQYGVGGLSPEALKLWFDQLSQFLANKINDIHDVLSSPEACDYIRMPQEDNKMSLKDFVESVATGVLVSDMLKAYPSATASELQPLQDVINSLAKEVSENKEGLYDLVESVATGMLVSDMLKAYPSATASELQPLQDIINSLAKGVSDNKAEVLKRLELVNDPAETTRVYTISKDGRQVVTVISEIPSPNAIALYGSNGNITSEMPTNDNHVVNKKYLDETCENLASEVALRIDEENDNFVIELKNSDGAVFFKYSIDIRDWVYKLWSDYAYEGVLNAAQFAIESEQASGYIPGGEIWREFKNIKERLEALEK